MPPKKKLRLDNLLAMRGLADSRERAQRLIRSGAVLLEGVLADKPGRMCDTDAGITLKESEKYVSRGGYKLEAALREFYLDVRGCAALDIGASTGGFTDCLLQHGAVSVLAIDVGRGQLHDSLRRDSRVCVLEKVNARRLDATHVPAPVDLAVVDVSFISLRLILPPVIARLKRGRFSVTLIKPQFEAVAREVQRGGVVRDPAVRQRVLQTIRLFGEKKLGLIWRAHCVSPLQGPAGNTEYFALWEKP